MNRMDGLTDHHDKGRTDRRALSVIGVALSVALVAAGLTALGRHRVAAAADMIEIHSAHGASFVPALRGDRPLFVLAIGSDDRAVGSPVEGQRADSIHIIGVDRSRQRATILGFPRDSWVTVPGHGRRKINDALDLGGPPLVVRTLERLTGIRIDFWLLTTFAPFVRMVNGIGGLTVTVQYPMHDRYSGADLDPGVRSLPGGQALSFARDRHDVPNGDFSRSLNQGRLLLAALANLREDFRRDPVSLFTWIALGWRNVGTDLDVQTLLQLAMSATQVPPSRVRNLVVPGTDGFAGTASVVFLSPLARRVYADMRKDGVVTTAYG